MQARVLTIESQGDGLGDLAAVGASVRARCASLEQRGYRVRNLEVRAVATYEAGGDDGAILEEGDNAD